MDISIGDDKSGSFGIILIRLSSEILRSFRARIISFGDFPASGWPPPNLLSSVGSYIG